MQPKTSQELALEREYCRSALTKYFGTPGPEDEVDWLVQQRAVAHTKGWHQALESIGDGETHLKALQEKVAELTQVIRDRDLQLETYRAVCDHLQGELKRKNDAG